MSAATHCSSVIGERSRAAVQGRTKRAALNTAIPEKIAECKSKQFSILKIEAGPTRPGSAVPTSRPGAGKGAGIMRGCQRSGGSTRRIRFTCHSGIGTHRCRRLAGRYCRRSCCWSRDRRDRRRSYRSPRFRRGCSCLRGRRPAWWHPCIRAGRECGSCQTQCHPHASAVNLRDRRLHGRRQAGSLFIPPASLTAPTKCKRTATLRRWLAITSKRQRRAEAGRFCFGHRTQLALTASSYSSWRASCRGNVRFCRAISFVWIWKGQPGADFASP